MTDDLLLWQLLDSAFPAGALAHSGGLEAAYQGGIVSGGDQLGQFLEAQLRATAFAAAAFAVAAFRRPRDWPRIDQTCDVFLSNHVANRASRAQGGTLLAAVARVFDLAPINRFRDEVRSRRAAGHYPVVLGALLSMLGVIETRVPQVLLFLSARAGVSSAVRLGIVGPMEAQSIQHALGPAIERWARAAGEIDISDAAQTSPVLDLLQGTQDRLYSRLFQS